MSEIHGTLDCVTVTLPKVSDRVPVREYLVRYVVVDEVDGMGGDCQNCLNEDVNCNIYITSNERGGDTYAQSCLGCSLYVVDNDLDTDPAHVVTIERLA